MQEGTMQISAGPAANEPGKGNDAATPREQDCDKQLGVNDKMFCSITQGVSSFLLHPQGF